MTKPKSETPKRLPTKMTVTPQGKGSYRGQWKYKGVPYSMTIYAQSIEDAKKQAEQEMIKIRAAIIEGAFCEKYGGDGPTLSTDTNNDDLQLDQVWGRYVGATTRPDTGKATLNQYEYQFNRFLSWTQEHHPDCQTFESVTDAIAQDFMAHLRDSDLSAATYNKYRQSLSLVFRVIGKMLKTKSNPFDDIQRRKHQPNRHRDLSEQEIDLVFEGLRLKASGIESINSKDGKSYVRRVSREIQEFAEEMLTAAMVALHTALRLKDCCLLKWSEVDFAARRIVCMPSKTKLTTGRTVRIPMSKDLFERMDEIRPKNPRGYVCPLVATKYLAYRDGVTDPFQRLFKSVGIQIHAEGTGPGTDKRAVVEVGFHSFRHTWATRAMRAGVRPDVIKELTGWSTDAMLDIYNHIAQDDIDSELGKLFDVHSAKPVLQVGGMTDDQLAETMKVLAEELRRREMA